MQQTLIVNLEGKKVPTTKIHSLSYMLQTDLFCSKVIKIINGKVYPAEG